MGRTPNNSRPTVRRAKIVSYEEAKRRTSANRTSVKKVPSGISGRLGVGQRKSFVIERGELREGALFDPSENISDEPKQDKSPKRTRVADMRESKRASRAESKRASRAEAKRARVKARADKKFDKTYGEAKSARPSAKSKRGAQPTPEGGPRPALYKGKMGSSQKKSSKLQARAAKMGAAVGSISIPRINLPKLPRKIGAALLTVCIVAVSAFALYGSAQQYYTQMRETDRLQAEYAAVAARTQTLQTSIDSLQTDAGIEDKAHSDMGYVKQGEQTATVKGITFEESNEFAGNVVPGSVPAPDTWYSPFLDVLFGYGQ